MHTGSLSRFLFSAAILAISQLAFGQKPKLEFEVATVKVQTSAVGIPIGSTGGPGTKRPEQLNIYYQTMESLLRRAFGVRSYSLSGPAWISGERYTIEAKVPAGASREDSDVMLQNLLIERFALKYHRETREVSGYELVVAKGGPKLKNSVVDPNAKGQITAALQKDRNGVPQLPPDVIALQLVGAGGCRNAIVAGRQPMDALADQLVGVVSGLPVVNKTGLTGKYDFAFLYMPLDVGPNAKGAAACALATNDGASIFSALQQELGLRLDAKKVPVEMVIVDQVNKTPTDN
jgi:uncharacterized protein (TIGR03435 family)